MGSWDRRVVVLAVLCCAATACGNSDVNLDRRGFFIGETATGGDLSILVGSVHSVFFVCGATDVFQRFDPPEPMARDGSFAVDVEGGGKHFTVSGSLVDSGRIEGAISGDPACNGDFVALRCDPTHQDCGDDDGDGIPNEIDPDHGTGTPTPVRTSTAGHTATPLRTSTPVSTTIGATPTLTPTPAATATPGGGLCGNGVIDADEECDGTDLDDQTCFDLCFDQDVEGGTLTCNVNCTFNFSQCLGTECSA